MTAVATLDTDAAFEAAVAALTVEEKARLLFSWRATARAGQVAPAGAWRTWLLLSGRGYGKTRAGAEWTREQVEENGRRRLALVASTAADARDVMVEGESGILAISNPSFMPVYEPSKRRLTWPNGAIATMYSADEPRRLRGPQHDAAWCDELASWRYAEAWDMLLFGLRLGDDPQVVVTTTPRPTRLIRDLLTKPTTVTTRGTTFDNRANLAEGFFEDIVAAYEGTTLGRQEIYGEVIEDLEGALWHRDTLEAGRLKYGDIPDLARIVVAVDPAVTSEAGSDETGIIVAGIDDVPQRAQGYVLEDLSGRHTPQGWAERAVAAYHEHEADCIVAEVNQGGDLVKAMLRMVDPSVPYKKVTATRGKWVRAEPVAALYQQGRIHHVGMLGPLEDQLCLSADTLVTTKRGAVRIAEVTACDRVLTRKGWRRVLWSGQTGTAPTIGVRTAGGRILRGTARHPVYVEGRGFVALSEVQTYDTLAVCRRPLSESSWPSTENATSATTTATSRPRALVAVACFIASCGRMLTGLYRRATLSTIATATGAITHSPTLRPCLVAATTEGTAHQTGSTRFGQQSSRLSERVPAGARSGRGAGTPPIALSADLVAERLSSRPPEPVFNLSVEDGHEFFASGLLVHNCNFTPDIDRKVMGSPDRVDALVWAFFDLIVRHGPIRKATQRKL